MALYKYFKKAVNEPMSEMLPSPDGPLSVHVPSSSIVQANKEVKPLLQPSMTSMTKDTIMLLVKRKRQKFRSVQLSLVLQVQSANQYKEELAKRQH